MEGERGGGLARISALLYKVRKIKVEEGGGKELGGGGETEKRK